MVFNRVLLEIVLLTLFIEFKGENVEIGIPL